MGSIQGSASFESTNPHSSIKGPSDSKPTKISNNRLTTITAVALAAIGTGLIITGAALSGGGVGIALIATGSLLLLAAAITVVALKVFNKSHSQSQFQPETSNTGPQSSKGKKGSFAGLPSSISLPDRPFNPVEEGSGQQGEESDWSLNLPAPSNSSNELNEKRDNLQTIHQVFTEKTPPASEKTDAERDVAATLIQKHVRGHLVRKTHLPRHLFSKYKEACKKAEDEEVKKSGSSSMPRAKGGATHVYLPQEVPEVALKMTNRNNVLKKKGVHVEADERNAKAIERFHQMQEVRSILNLQKSSHLIIPKANLYGNFLVEEKLPINVDDYHNLELYHSQPELFDDAVRELTTLFSKVYLSDLLVSQRSTLFGNLLPGTYDQVRYDNLPLYVVEKNGKKEGRIGLIDLESLKKKPDPKGLETLVRIFPCHLAIIKEKARELNMKINETALEKAAETGNRYFQEGFAKHRNWLKEKGISSEPLRSFEISEQGKEVLTSSIEKELLKLNQGTNDLYIKRGYVNKPLSRFLGESPEEGARKLAAQITPMIISSIKSNLEEAKEQELKKHSDWELTETQLVNLRSPLIKMPSLYEHVNEQLVECIEKNSERYIDSTDIKLVAEQLVHFALQEMGKAGEIFQFIPGVVKYDFCWIRY